MRQRQLNLFDPPDGARPVYVVNSPLLNDEGYREESEPVHWLKTLDGKLELRPARTADDVNYLLGLRDGAARVWFEGPDVIGYADDAHISEEACAHNLNRLAAMLRVTGLRSGGIGKHYGGGKAESVLISFGVPVSLLPQSYLWYEGRKKDLFEFRAAAARDGSEVRVVV